MVKKVCVLFAVLGIPMLFFCGCDSAELEERKFPLTIAFDEQDQGCVLTLGLEYLSGVAEDENSAKEEEEEEVMAAANWVEAFSDQDEKNPETMDYNHVKAVIISRAVLEDKEMLNQLLDYLETEELLSRNTLVFTCRDRAADLLALEGALPMAEGMYLKQLTDGMTMQKDTAVVTLGNLMNERYNRMENLYLPVLEEQEQKPVICGYYALAEYTGMGMIKPEVYEAATLLENKRKLYQFDLDTGETIELSRIWSSGGVTSDEEKTVKEVCLSADAKIISKNADAAEKKRAERQIREYLNSYLAVLLANSLTSNDLDLTNSYYSLGGYNRKLYKKYEDRPQAYRRNLEYRVDCRIDVI